MNGPQGTFRKGNAQLYLFTFHFLTSQTSSKAIDMRFIFPSGIIGIARDRPGVPKDPKK